jgi:dTDP-4-dehydrorhamnose reductase
VLILGAGGQLGSALASVFADRRPATPSRDLLDIENARAVQAAIETLRPAAAINASAFHNVPLCEEQPERAFAVNAEAPDRLAALCARAGSLLVHVSTDYVFSGEKQAPYVETDACVPLNAYGASKLAGERLIARRGGRYLLVRTSGLYGWGTRSSAKGLPFIEKILRAAERGEPLRVVDDITFSPSYAPHVARAVRALIEREATGVFHLSNAGACTWREFAAEALAQAGLRARIEGIPSVDVPVRRPRYSAFSLAKAKNAGVEMPDWREGVRAYIKRRADVSIGDRG